MLGADFGSLLCFLYTQERGLIAYVFEDKVEELAAHMELFIQVYGLFAEGLPKPEDVRETLYWFESDNTDPLQERRVYYGKRAENVPVSGIAPGSGNPADGRYIHRRIPGRLHSW